MKRKAIFTILILLLLTIYLTAGIFFKNHFLPNTYINNIDCSYLTPHAANQKIIENLYNDNVLINSDINSFQIKETHFDYTKLQDSSEFIDNKIKFDWVKHFSENTNYTIPTNDIVDSAIENILTEWDIFNEDNWTKSENAHIIYDEKNKEYTIIPETQGTEINIDIATEKLRKILTREETTLKIDTDNNFYLKALVNKDNKKLNGLKNNLNEELNKNLNYSLSNKTISIDKNLISKHIKYNLDNYSYETDYESIANDYIQLIEEKFNTLNTERGFITTLGDTVHITNGNWGWKVNSSKTKENIMHSLKTNEPLNIEWKQTAGINPENNNDFVNYIEIDLTNQKLYMYKNKELLVESDIVSGNIAEGHKTPGGIFKLSYKTRNATLRGPGYASFVYYWMPFNGGIGMHDATWRSSFGGSIYKNNGSHGCINMPLENAKIVYQNIDDTYAIICYWR